LLALFAVSQFVLSWLVESGAPELRDPEFYRRLARLRARQAEYPNRPLTLTLGSSRMIMSVKPSVVADRLERPGEPLLFNFGVVAAGPLMERLTLDRLLRVGVRPDHVLVEFWPPYFVENEGWYEESRTDSARFDRDDVRLLARYSRDPARLTDGWFRARVVPSYQQRLALMNVVKPSWLSYAYRQDYRWASIDDWGWKPSHDQPADQAGKPARTALAQHLYISVLKAEAPGPAAVRAFDDLLTTCRQEGIPATVVWLPEGSEVRSWYPLAAQRWAAELFASYRDRFGARLIDARLWAPDDDSLDSIHLTRDGATAFTKVFWPAVSSAAPEVGETGR
jgi:hypothetical protein